MTTASVSRPSPVRAMIGTTFVGPGFDYVVIGGAWSIVAALVLVLRPDLAQRMDVTTLAVLVLLVNSAHFAASTLRLYDNPQYFQDHRFLTLGLPIVTLAVLALCLAFPAQLGRHLQALYLTWSPFHYAAQTYGLAVMYSMRSGCRLDQDEKRLLWWVCMLPFLRAFLGSPDAGLGWFVSREWIAAVAYAPMVLQSLTDALLIATFLAPIWLSWRLYRTDARVLPLMVVVLTLANGLWWTALDYVNAFVIATIAHGAQYMAIVIVYHVRERLRRPDNTRGWGYHATSFYARSLLLGYALFYCWPYFYVWASAGMAESMLLVTATINVHHFIVDRYIWRLRAPANARTIAEVPV